MNVPLKWTIKDNNTFAKNKFRFSHNEVPWKYRVNSQNTYTEVWPQQNCIAALLKSNFGLEITLQTRRSLLVRRPMKDCFWKENCVYEKIYMYQTLAWCASDSPCPCYHPHKPRKRKLGQAMKSPPKGKAAWADILHAKL